jgi:predicted nucleic acid-binding protein
MIVLDTNVLSELIKPLADKRVLAWARAMYRLELFTTAINEAELLQGVELLPRGKKRAWLGTEIVRMLREDFADRILSFDSRAAQSYAVIVCTRKNVGRPVGILDAQIAAIARAHGGAVATRDTGDFEHCGIELINPWDYRT